MMDDSTQKKQEEEYKDLLNRRADILEDDRWIVELGPPRKGKTWDVYFSYGSKADPLPEAIWIKNAKKIKDPEVKGYAIMVATDRISAFDKTLPIRIPHKGKVLALLTQNARSSLMDTDLAKYCIPSMNREEDDVGIRNDLVMNCSTRGSNIVVQRRAIPIPVECIVRGYVWGSMADAYENGEEQFCGINFSDLKSKPSKNGGKTALMRYSQLEEPIFTPTTKAPLNEKDTNLTPDELVQLVGQSIAQCLKDISIRLYKHFSKLAEKAGLLLLDTKYEFGLISSASDCAEQARIVLIDEVNTPDSSRFCDINEYEQKIATIISSRERKEIGDQCSSIKQRCKISELSKQYIRDIISSSKSSALPTRYQIIECAYRYIRIYERLTGERFMFVEPHESLGERTILILRRCFLIHGYCAVLICGSASDLVHAKQIQMKLDEYKIPYVIRICSAHKQQNKFIQLIEEFNMSAERLVIICIAGGTDAISGGFSFHSYHPVLSCPPPPIVANYPEGLSLNESCIRNPVGSSNAYIMHPFNAAKFVAQAFCDLDENLRSLLRNEKHIKLVALEESDSRLLEEYAPYNVN